MKLLLNSNNEAGIALFAWQIRRHLALEQPKGIQSNDFLDSFLAKYGVSGQMTGPYLEEFVRSLGSGMLLKANCRFLLPSDDSGQRS